MAKTIKTTKDLEEKPAYVGEFDGYRIHHRDGGEYFVESPDDDEMREGTYMRHGKLPELLLIIRKRYRKNSPKFLQGKTPELTEADFAKLLAQNKALAKLEEKGKTQLNDPAYKKKMDEMTALEETLGIHAHKLEELLDYKPDKVTESAL